MRMRRNPGTGLLLALAMALTACGGDAGSGDGGAAAAAEAEGAPTSGEATPSADPTELARQIGPVREVELGPIEAELAETGEQVFTSKCSACHKLDERYVGPPLGGVAERRSPVFLMNMMLNPEGMVRDHPEVKAMLAQYYTPMPNQGLTEDEARAVLEYLRAAAAEEDAEASDEAHAGDDADASEEQE